MPAKKQDMNTQSGLTARLEELKKLLSQGLITQAEHDDGRAAALGITAKTASNAVSVENTESKNRRELLALIQKWIGTKEAPCLAGDLHDAVTVGTGDEGLRQQIATLTTESRLAIELMAIFKGAPKGTVPAAFAGVASEPLRFARLAAREFLLGLSAALAVSQANKLEKLAEDERKVLWEETLLLIDDDDSAANTSTVLANLKVHRATRAAAKRLRDEDAEPGKAPAKPQTLNEKQKKALMKQGLCFKCNKKGHVSHNCPN